MEAGQAQLLTDYLNRMKFMMRVEVRTSVMVCVLESAATRSAGRFGASGALLLRG